jgi:hypothetical protein
MSLNWDLSKIKDQETLCWVGVADDAPMNPITEALIFASIAIGTPMITAENVAEAYTRLSMWQDVVGALVVDVGGADRFVTPDDVRAHIGLKTNASAYTTAKFNGYIIKALREQAKRRFEK